MILIALGANLPSPVYGSPLNTLKQALVELENSGIRLVRISSWYRTAPVPRSDQPWFVNAVAEMAVDLGPVELMQILHGIETRLGRQRRERWEARTVDLDLLAYNDLRLPADAGPDTLTLTLTLPHPRLHQRRFVLEPLVEIAPDWRHPVLAATATDLLAGLHDNDIVRKMDL